MRRFVIGDIHGCAKALRTLIESIAPTADDELVFLGDYIDRGPDSRNVIDQILDLNNHCRVVPLRGNHEIMLLGVLLGGCDSTVWLSSGGQSTITSYGGTLSRIPESHVDFFQNLRPFYEIDSAFFIHAGYLPDLPLNKLDDAVTYWNHLTTPVVAPHFSGKTAFIGHTPQPGGEVLDLGHLVCVDTYCFGGGYLTALDIDSRETYQVSSHGHLRRDRQIMVPPWMRYAWNSIASKLGNKKAENQLATPQQTAKSPQINSGSQS